MHAIMNEDNGLHQVHFELLPPKQSTTTLEADLEKFADRYRMALDAGFAVSITDNPMGTPRFQATEILPELELPIVPDRVLIHLSTFHTRASLDEILGTASDLGVRQLLTVSGDGGERLPKLKPDAIGVRANAVTSVELLEFIGREHADRFTCGVAFNPYEPQEHEREKMKRKIDAGAAFAVTQPLLGVDDRVDALRPFGVPVVIGAWMSTRLHLLSECVGYEIPEDAPYDPIANLRALRTGYPDDGIYLALLHMKKQFPLIRDLLPKGERGLPHDPVHEQHA